MAQTKIATRRAASGKLRWDHSHGAYITARSQLDAVDELAIAMERKWGCGRLRLLVDATWREKFDRQRYLLNQAIQSGELADVLREALRAQNAWRTLDELAMANGAQVLAPEVWEAVLSDGTVMAIVPDSLSAKYAIAGNAGRQMVCFTVAEVAQLMDHHRKVVEAKLSWPGATVVAVNDVRAADPLDAIGEAVGLDAEWEAEGDVIPF